MKKRFKWIIIVSLILILTILYARYIGTKGFVTKEYALYQNELPSGFNGLKVVHFSDLHYNRAISLDKVESIVDEINLINPDIVVFTGDLIDRDTILDEKDLEELIKVLNNIKSKYGKYSVMGNHDYHKHKDTVIRIYNESNFKYLDNSHDIIYNNKKEGIFIGGINTVSYGEHDLDKTFKYFDKHDDIDYKIVLVHEPDITDQILDHQHVDLILSGHSHNGQVRLPIIGAIYTPPHSKKYYDEYYNINGADLYISSGIGVSTLNFRLWNRPSINFYRINK